MREKSRNRLKNTKPVDAPRIGFLDVRKVKGTPNNWTNSPLPGFLRAHQGYLLDRIQIRIVTNALFVRRLLETPKVATALREADVSVIAHPWTGSNVDYMNCHHIDQKYQINNPTSKRLRGGVLCDQIIHSFVWAWISDEYGDNLKAFIVSSDRKKHSVVYVVDMDDWLEYTQGIANSSPKQMYATRDIETGQWIFTSH